jgi:endonuclease YncB( thermonuclease family)
MKLLIATALIALTANVFAEPVKVVKVIDGDTVWVERAGSVAIKVRLRYIDAPESCQPYGDKSTKTMSDIALGRQADLKITGRSYDRYVGALTVNGADVATMMVQTGNAWVYRSGVSKKSPLRALEDTAKANKFGLWRDPSPVPPWEFRKTNRCPHKSV